MAKKKVKKVLSSKQLAKSFNVDVKDLERVQGFCEQTRLERKHKNELVKEPENYQVVCLQFPVNLFFVMPKKVKPSKFLSVIKKIASEEEMSVTDDMWDTFHDAIKSKKNISVINSWEDIKDKDILPGRLVLTSSDSGLYYNDLIDTDMSLKLFLGSKKKTKENK